MQSGTTIESRFRLLESAHNAASSARSIGVDTRLNQDVWIAEAPDLASERVLAAAALAHTVTHPVLERLLAAVDRDDEAVLVVTVRSKGIVLAELLPTVRIPLRQARAILSALVAGVEAAHAGGLVHGAIGASDVTVTTQGRVVLRGMGLQHALRDPAGPAPVPAADVRALVDLFVEITTGRSTAALKPKHFPVGLSTELRDVLLAASTGAYPESAAELAGLFAGKNTAALARVKEQARQFPPSLEVKAEFKRLRKERKALARAEAAAVAEAERIAAEAALLAEQAGAGEVHVIDGVVIDGPPRPYDGPALLDPQPVSLREAIFERLHFWFPNSARIEKWYSAAHESALVSVRINPAPIMMLLGLAAMVVVSMGAYNMFREPYVPTIDLHNHPQQTYPVFQPSPTVTIVDAE